MFVSIESQGKYILGQVGCQPKSVEREMGLNKRLTFGIHVLLVGLLMMGGSGIARAQTGFNVQNFHPLPAHWVNYFSVGSAEVMQDMQWEFAAVIHYSADPLVIHDTDGEQIGTVVPNQLVANLQGAIGIIDLLEIGFDVPIVLLQDEADQFAEDIGIVFGTPGAGLGDIRLVPKLSIFDTIAPTGGGGLALGVLLNTWLPTGDSDTYQGEGFRMEPRLMLDFALSNDMQFAINVGYMFRERTKLDISPEEHFGEDAPEDILEVFDSITYGVAASFPAIEDTLYIVPEVFGSVSTITGTFDGVESPVEAILGAKIFPTENLIVEAGAGVGLTAGYGAPTFRALLGVAYNSGERPLHCEAGPEDIDGFEDDDTCIDPDNDQDTFLDADDPCPNEPEDFDGFEDEGCPDPDNDQDTILDIADACPLDPEDLDGWEDEDGCPDPDNDFDTFLDVDDACPNEAEVFNEFEDDDGCPDVAIVVTCERIEIDDRVYFEFDSDVIQRRSYELLDRIASTVNERYDLLLVRVEGHTDGMGTDEYNQVLSDSRATAVRDYLINVGGVDDYRLVAQGFGESVAIDTNDTEAGRANNRRVEFIIVEQEGCME